MRRVIAYHGRCFDGAFSAALMSALSDHVDGPAREVVFRSLAHQKGRGIDEGLLDGDVNAVVDFRYTTSVRLSWWFDHHQSAFIDEEHRVHFEARAGQRRFFAPEASSCAKLIYDVSRERFGVTISVHPEVLDWADRIDSARFDSSAQAVELTHPALQLMTYIETASPDEIGRLIPRLTEEPLLQLVEQEPVCSALEPVLASHREVIERFRGAARLDGAVVFADLSDRPLDGFNKFIGFYLLPEAVYSVVVTEGPSRTKVSVGTNPWRSAERRHDIAALCEPHGGGGHAAVGAVTLPPGRRDEARRVAAEIVQQLSRSTP